MIIKYTGVGSSRKKYRIESNQPEGTNVCEGRSLITTNQSQSPIWVCSPHASEPVVDVLERRQHEASRTIGHQRAHELCSVGDRRGKVEARHENKVAGRDISGS
jgi:hypothetical protein